MTPFARLLAALVVLALLSPLAACGRRGNPLVPEGSTYPRAYPPS